MQARLTNKQVADIARATRRICTWTGSGHHVVVWPDYTWEEATDANNCIARMVGEDRETPVAGFRNPTTIAEVKAALVRSASPQFSK